MTLISVVVPTCNRADIIGETIQSILNQSYQNIELIIVDDESTDNTEEAVKLFKDSRIKYIKIDKWGGPARPRNVGLTHAKGEYVAFCDDDDIWVKDKLQLQMDVINMTNCDIVYSNMLYFKGDKSILVKKRLNKKINNLKDLINYNEINTSSVLVRNRDLFFPEDTNLIAIEDYALWLNLCLKGYHFEFLNKPLVYFRINEMSIFRKSWETNHLKLIYLYTSLLLRNPELPIKTKVLSKILWNFLKFSIKNEYFKNRIRN